MQVYKFYVVALLSIISCAPVKNEGEVVIKNRDIEIVIPSEFGIVDSGALDNNGYLVSQIFDTCFYEIGLSVNTLAENCPEVVYITRNAYDKVVESLPVGPYYTSELNFDLDRLKKQNVEFYRVGNSPVKLTKPITTKGGIVGIYIDSIGIGNQLDAVGMIKFSMYTKVNELKETDLYDLIELYRSIDVRQVKN
ncbi:MAG: hypothetical protein KDC56_04155 [Flavobacteriaceae bacterium]|nr:hypothetical protein [Flavobacteriaceae bacterium]